MRVGNQWRFFKTGNNLVIPRKGYRNEKQEAKGLFRKLLTELSQTGRRDILKPLTNKKFEERLVKWSSYSKCNLDSTECMKAYFASLKDKIYECKIDFVEFQRQTKIWAKRMMKKYNK